MHHSILKLLDQASQQQGPILIASMTPPTRAVSESIGYCISGMLASDLKSREVISPCHPDEGLEMYRRPFNQYSQTSGELNRFEAYGAIFQYKFDTYPNGSRASRDRMTHLLIINFQDGAIPDEVNACLIYQVQKSLTIQGQCSYPIVMNEIENHFIFTNAFGQSVSEAEDIPLNQIKGQKGKGKGK